jgi:ABC-type branched-subunit amino acid transport system substrate-binding protein
MRKKIVIGVVVLAIGVLILNTHTTNKKVKIGIITPLTGQYAMYGEVNKNAAAMAEDKFGKDNVEIYVEDDAYDAKKAVSAYKKLRSINDVDAVIVLGAPSIQSIAPLTDADNIPLLGLGVTLVYKKDSVFQLLPAGNTVEPLSGKLYSEKYNSIVVAHSNAELFTQNAEGFIKGMDPKDLIANVSIPPASDYRTEVSKILKMNPDLISVNFPLEDSLKFLKALRVLDPEKKVHITCDFTTELAPDKFIEAFGADRLEGCISVFLGETASGDFKKEYKQRFGIDMQLTGDSVFEGINMILDLSKKYPRDEWVKQLSLPTYVHKGTATGDIKFNDDGTRLDNEPVVSVFKEGKFKRI